MSESGNGTKAIRDAIRATDDRPIVAVAIKDWSRTIHVRRMSAMDLDRREAYAAAHRSSGDDLESVMCGLRARMAVLAACDEKGELLFEWDDAEWLSEKSGAALDQIIGAAQGLSGITDAQLRDLSGN